jgi:hypothetical protein
MLDPSDQAKVIEALLSTCAASSTWHRIEKGLNAEAFF